MKAPASAAKKVGAEPVAAHGGGYPRGGDEALHARAAEQEAGDEHADEQQRQDLLGEAPGLVEPIAQFAIAREGDPAQAEGAG
jgi:hypothetical protein